MCIVQCRVIVDNKGEFQHSSSRGDCTFDARLASKTLMEEQATVFRCCLDDLRSPTLVEKKKTRSECCSVVVLKLCQQILVQPIQCVRSRRTRVPTQFNNALQNQALLPSPESVSFRLVQVIAKIRTVSVHSVTLCVWLAFRSLLLSSSSSLFMVHWSCQEPKLVYLCQWFHSMLHTSSPTQPFPTIVPFLDVSSIPMRAHDMSPTILWRNVGSTVRRMSILQKLQCCCSTEVETGFVPTSA